MNKKILIIVITLIIVLALGIGLTMLIGNKNNKTGNVENNEIQNNETEITSNKFSFVLDMSELTDEWWNSLNEEWMDFEYTNKKLYDTRWEKELGNSGGKLQIRPVGFTENIKVGSESVTARDEYYTLTIKDNDFLIPQQLKVIDDNINHASAELDFYVLGSDLWFYNVSLWVEENPTDIELVEGTWKTEINEENDYILVNSYYPINIDYCLHIYYPTSRADGSEKLKEEALKELANSVTSIITLDKIEDTTNVDNSAFKVEQEDIKLDDNTVVLMNSLRMKSWHSGAGDIVSNISEGDTVITAYNASGDWTYITEYNKDKDIEDYFDYVKQDMKEYNYNGRNIYIVYYTDEATSTFKGKYQGIMFRINDIWYEISGVKPIDPNETDIDTWIENMCDGVISFK